MRRLLWVVVLVNTGLFIGTAVGQDAGKSLPELSSEILGPQLVAWSKVQEVQPVSESQPIPSQGYPADRDHFAPEPRLQASEQAEKKQNVTSSVDSSASGSRK